MIRRGAVGGDDTVRTASFRICADLPHSPEQAWQLLTDPAWMNIWSEAFIELAAPGAGGRPDTVGALRTVTLPNGRTRLKEVVEESAYPSRFVYRVFDGGPALLSHLGVQEIHRRAEGSHLTWTVHIGLVASIANRLMVRTMERQVRASVAILAKNPAVTDAPPTPPPATAVAHNLLDERDPDRAAEAMRLLDVLRADAEAVLASQVRIADRLAEAADPKQWFARVYTYVTEEMIDACGTSRLDHPDWVLSLIPVFDRYYTRNLAAYEAGEPCEPAWEKAWSLCERRDESNPARPVMRGLLAGVSAHIDADLPRALVDVQRESFQDRDIREFRPDYLRLAPVFTAASDRLLRVLPRSHTPWWTGAASRIHPQVRDSLLARRGYDVGRHRIRAFAAAVDALA